MTDPGHGRAFFQGRNGVDKDDPLGARFLEASGGVALPDQSNVATAAPNRMISRRIAGQDGILARDELVPGNHSTSPIDVPATLGILNHGYSAMLANALVEGAIAPHAFAPAFMLS